MSTPAAHPRRRWFQFSLRGLLLLILLAAVGAFAYRIYLEPYRRQRETIEVVKKLGGAFETAEATAWQRRLFGGDYQNLTYVNLADADDPNEYLSSLVDLPCVEILVVGGVGFGDEHVRRLHGLRSLEYLVLDSTAVTSSGIELLKQDLPGIQVHRLQGRAILALREMRAAVGDFDTGKNDPELARRLPSRSLHRAYVCWLRHFHDDLSGLAWVGMLTELESLDLTDTQVTDAEMPRLESLVQLKTLDLHYAAITDAGLAHLSSLGKLETLRLGCVEITGTGLAHLRDLRRIIVLDLNGTRLGDSGAAHVGELSSLVELNFNRTGITDAGLAHLQRLTKLKTLELNQTAITDAGLAHLHSLSQLESLWILGTQTTCAGVMELKRALPKCEVIATAQD